MVLTVSRPHSRSRSIRGYKMSNSNNAQGSNSSGSFSLMNLCGRERYEIITSMITTMMIDGEIVTAHLQKMQRYVDRLQELNVDFNEELEIDIILHSLPPCYNQFHMTYHMNKEEVTLSKLQGLLRTAERNLKDKSIASTPTVASVLAIMQGKGKKRKAPSKSHHKGSPMMAPLVVEPKLVSLHPPPTQRMQSATTVMRRGNENEVARSTCKISRMERSIHPTQGLRRNRDVEHGRINLIMGNRRSSSVTKIGVYSLVLSNGLGLDLNNCCYSPEMERNIISFHALYRQGFRYSFDNEKDSINAYLNGVFCFKALPCNGIYETVMVIDNLGNDVLCIDSSNSLDKACL
uniref:Retrovirus-related Pol polyprotein from transposon TNT 1-94 n=1 Tax=Lactuca sativa TaxID=4236 RepID=A0A9R1WW18_LACSA|nr:hypothetical protein LSAT_V11C900495440 [Lactuca sativa]